MGRQKSYELNKVITENDKIIRKELFKNYFQFQSLSDMQKKSLKHRMQKKIKNLAQEIQSRLDDFEKEITNMSTNERPYEILVALVQIHDFNSKIKKEKD